MIANTRYGDLDALGWSDGSLEAWIKPVAAVAGLVAEFTSGGRSVWKLTIGADLYLTFEQPSQALARLKSPLQAGKWHHMAMVARYGRVTILIDGRTSAEVARAVVSPAKRIQFGPLAGLLDEVAIYDRPLSAAEIGSIMTSSRTCLDGFPREHANGSGSVATNDDK